MAEARQLKAREYYTNVIAHDQTIQNRACEPHRNTNTFRSLALDQTPVQDKVIKARTHDRIFGDKTYADGVTRASYQDSNPLNVTQRATDKTILKNSKFKANLTIRISWNNQISSYS